jgi:integrase
MIDKATQPLKSMILLGINCGLGQSGLSSLPRAALNLKTGWMNYPRPKTGIERRCWLWPETAKSLREVLKDTPNAADPADDGLVFITKYGARWSRTNDVGTNIDAISQEFRKLMTALEFNGHRGFYCLRHGFETVGGESRDQVAVNHAMGHVDSSMAGLYREAISDDRLKAVAEHVRKWLFSAKAKVKKATPKKQTRQPSRTRG